MIAPPHTCGGCGRIVRGRCPRCRALRERARPTAAARGYDAEWTAYSQRWLAMHRWCGERQDYQLYPDHSRCVQYGQRTRAACTDHIVPLARGGAKLDPANHQSLCTGCNVRKGSNPPV